MTEELNGGCLDGRGIRDALAAGPTLGTWTGEEISPEDPEWGASEVWAGDEVVATHVCGIKNAAFIAACNPVAIAALLAELDTLRASLSTSKQAGAEPLLMQDENSGKDGRRYNEWHASRPDARLNAREAAQAAVMPAAPSDAAKMADRLDWAATSANFTDVVMTMQAASRLLRSLTQPTTVQQAPTDEQIIRLAYRYLVTWDQDTLRFARAVLALKTAQTTALPGGDGEGE